MVRKRNANGHFPAPASPRKPRLGPLCGIATLLALAASLGACRANDPAHRLAHGYDGQRLFLDYCASCHGPVGAGDGPMAAQLAGALPDLRDLAARNDGTFPRQQLIEMVDGRNHRTIHGSADMPVWGLQFRREEGMTTAGIQSVNARIEALVDHIESLQRRAP